MGTSFNLIPEALGKSLQTLLQDRSMMQKYFEGTGCKCGRGKAQGQKVQQGSYYICAVL